MIKNDLLPGQMSIFDFDLTKPKETKPVFKFKDPDDDKFTKIIDLYKSTAARIVKQVCGALLVEVEDKTLYFNSEGVKELELKKDMELMPADEILVVNQDREVNELQIEKLKNMHVEQYIKRKGDVNIIIPFHEKIVVINPKGWILEYLQKPKYHKNELFITQMDKESTILAINDTKMDINIIKSVNESDETENDKIENLELRVGDKVEFNYDGPQMGNVSRIYNNGVTVNVVWNNKSTAFYYKCVKRIS